MRAPAPASPARRPAPQEALAEFDGAVLRSLQETETALSVYANSLRRLEALKAARDEAEVAARIVRAQQREGRGGFARPARCRAHLRRGGSRPRRNERPGLDRADRPVPRARRRLGRLTASAGTHPFWRNDPAILHGWPHICPVMNSALSTSSGPTDLRHGARTHLFVISTLCWDAGSAPVHVRNMSANGALIEAADPPAPGSPFVLKRGSLKVGGRIAWAASRQAGLAFGAAVCVADWMARQANARQDQIDEIVSALRSAPIGQRHLNSPEARFGSDLHRSKRSFPCFAQI